jgi:hypothetical protein
MAILDRIDKIGKLPQKMTIHCDSEIECEVARQIFSSKVVRKDAHRKNVIQLNLKMAAMQQLVNGGLSLQNILYLAANRKPQDLRGDALKRSEWAEGIVIDLLKSFSGAAQLYLQEIGLQLKNRRGDFYKATLDTQYNLKDELTVIARCISLAEMNDHPTRLANFSRRATGSTKGLRIGGKRYVKVADALLRYIPGMADIIHQDGIINPNEIRRQVFEKLNIFRNETPIDVLCFGNLIFEIGTTQLNEMAVHYNLGQPIRLLLLHLRRARIIEMNADRVVCIENETTFNDYVDWIKSRRENDIVLCTGGQANWATIQLLRIIEEAKSGILFYHWGDLDRAGVLILRSLHHRTGLDIKPLWMDRKTLSQYADKGQKLPSKELKEISSLIDRHPGEVGEDLLRELLRVGRWVEQESVAEGELFHKPD